MRIIREGSGHAGRRFIAGLLIMLIILAVAGWFGVRTQGARDLIEERLSRYTGLDVTIQSARIAWPYDLLLEHVEASLPGAETPVPGMSAGRLRLGWRPAGRLIALDRARLSIRNEEDGDWSPAFFSGLGDLLGAPVSEISRLTAGLRSRRLIRVTDGAVVWLDALDHELTLVEGITFSLTPVRTPRFPMTFYELSVERVRGAVAAELRDMRWTWLAYEQSDYIELEAVGRRVRFGR